MAGCKVITVDTVERDGVLGIVYNGEFIPMSDLYTIDEAAKYDGIDSLDKCSREFFLKDRAQRAAQTRWQRQRQENKKKVGRPATAGLP